MLNNKEWLRINDIILLIHSEEDLTAVRSHFLETVKPLVLYEKALFYLLEECDNRIEIRDPVFAHADCEFLRMYENLFQNWRYGKVAVNSRRTIAFRDSDLIPEIGEPGADAYASFPMPQHLPYGGGIVIAGRRKLLAEVAFFRTEKQGDFKDKEIYILDILKQHLQIRFMRECVGNAGRGKDAYTTVKLMELGLTNREVEIAKLVAAGFTNAEIADRLHISIYTAKRHLNNIFSKLATDNRMQLIEYITNLE